MVRIPPKDEYQRRWAEMGLADRRRVLRAVNRGRALDDPREAAIAVVTARSQKRFWSRAWLLGPVSSLLILIQDVTWQQWAVQAVLITVLMGLMSVFWYRRAERAETANLEVASRRKARRRKGAGRGGRSSRHTPKRRGDS